MSDPVDDIRDDLTARIDRHLYEGSSATDILLGIRPILTRLVDTVKADAINRAIPAIHEGTSHAYRLGRAEGIDETTAAVEAVLILIDRHIEHEPEEVEYRHPDTGAWHDVTADIRAALASVATPAQT